MPEAVCLLDARVRVGESPVWCSEEQALYWVDIYGHRLNRLDPASGRNHSWDVGEPIGSFALRERGGFLLALKSGLYLFDPAAGARDRVAALEPHRPQNRLNDGRCDRTGRFWVGSMADPPDAAEQTGTLHRFDPGSGSTSMVEGLIVSNGLAFSPDDRTLYLSDSHASVRTIWAFDFDAADGTLRNRRVFVGAGALSAAPDGAAIDAEGCYWTASNGGGELMRFTPAGKFERRIRLPVKRPAMACFGGHDLRTIFVTSCRTPGVDHSDEPLAGGIFAIEQDILGLPEPRFRG